MFKSDSGSKRVGKKSDSVTHYYAKQSGVCALLLNVSFQSQQRSMSNLVEYTTLQMFWLSGIFSAIECTWIIRLSWLKLLLTCTRRKKNGKDYVERSNTCSTLMAPQKILLLSVVAMKQTPLKSVVVVLPCSTAKHKCCCHLGPLFCFRLFPYVLLSDLFMAGNRWREMMGESFEDCKLGWIAGKQRVWNYCRHLFAFWSVCLVWIKVRWHWQAYC